MDADGWMAPVIKTMGFLVEGGGFLISRGLNGKIQFSFMEFEGEVKINANN